eukprot:CAMPEP_0178397844 /NCGR_PEP_ID=MMETSP0689_2-20121128/14464_1 /TAXON_ID=160604 /ORGANISM="Amphidinium massartii, Strain CS-259" /LENGTH=77 /DNA_ID=CAMNT_0020018583 /DNA_START=348 /DNA_END=581 /DNA_ORIENTATION=+
MATRTTGEKGSQMVQVEAHLVEQVPRQTARLDATIEHKGGQAQHHVLDVLLAAGDAAIDTNSNSDEVERELQLPQRK